MRIFLFVALSMSVGCGVEDSSQNRQSQADGQELSNLSFTGSCLPGHEPDGQGGCIKLGDDSIGACPDGTGADSVTGICVPDNPDPAEVCGSLEPWQIEDLKEANVMAAQQRVVETAERLHELEIEIRQLPQPVEFTENGQTFRIRPSSQEEQTRRQLEIQRNNIETELTRMQETLLEAEEALGMTYEQLLRRPTIEPLPPQSFYEQFRECVTPPRDPMGGQVDPRHIVEPFVAAGENLTAATIGVAKCAYDAATDPQGAMDDLTSLQMTLEQTDMLDLVSSLVDELDKHIEENGHGNTELGVAKAALTLFVEAAVTAGAHAGASKAAAQALQTIRQKAPALVDDFAQQLTRKMVESCDDATLGTLSAVDQTPTMFPNRGPIVALDFNKDKDIIDAVQSLNHALKETMAETPGGNPRWLLEAHHGSNPNVTAQIPGLISDPEDLSTIWTLACGYRGCDARQLSELLPNTTVIGTKQGYLTVVSSVSDVSDQVIVGFVEPTRLNRWTGGILSDNYKLADPAEALAVFRNGQLATHITHAERLIPIGSGLLTSSTETPLLFGTKLPHGVSTKTFRSRDMPNFDRLPSQISIRDVNGGAPIDLTPRR